MKDRISVEETLEVVKNLNRGSAPGPDRLSVPYYKTFAETLAPYLTKFFNEKATGSPLNPDLNTAFITVILKQEKNPKEVGNYRPISWINNDLKILTKILANRLNSFIKSYIYKDQVSFIPGRQGPDQTRRTIDIASILQMNWPGGVRQQGMLLSLDIQKAFDSVSWQYIFSLFDHWGFGERFLGTIEALYSWPTALIRLLVYHSSPIRIARGTRQGCPLSPLVFAIAIETLAIEILVNPDIRGFPVEPRSTNVVYSLMT